MDWYQERLRGGSRGEAYELVFARVPQEEWDKGPAAANAWVKAHLPPSSEGTEPQLEDKQSLEIWLRRKGQEAAVVIAARAALRVLPCAIQAPLPSETNSAAQIFKALNGAIFRASASSWVRAKYLARLRDFDTDSAAMTTLTNLMVRVGFSPGSALVAAGSVVSAVTATFAESATNAANAAEAAGEVESYWINDGAEEEADHAFATWGEIRGDATSLEKVEAAALADLTLWSHGAPDWAEHAWRRVRAALPRAEDWDVWIDWYEERLRGGSRGEDYELVFASVPQGEWDKGPAAANAWIKARLPAEHKAPQTRDEEFFKAWVKTQPPEYVNAIVVRSALRVVPLAARAARHHNIEDAYDFQRTVEQIFYSLAWAR